MQKLLDSGLIEICKVVNDLYSDDIDIISLNFETLKKISNLKAGREIILKKNIIPNLMKNIKATAHNGNSKAVIAGFTVLDNLLKSDEGKEVIKENKAFDNISEILACFENDEKVLKMGAKLFSKISKPEDMINEIYKLEELNQKNDMTDCKLFFNLVKELEKSLILVSNYMLVDDICKNLCSPDKVALLQQLFDKVSNIDLSNKSADYVKNFILMNKYFMIIFNRLFTKMPYLIDNTEFVSAINNSYNKNYKAYKSVSGTNGTITDTTNNNSPLTKAFKEFYSSFAEIFDKISKERPNVEVTNCILHSLVESNKDLLLDEKCNLASSKIFNNAINISDPETTRYIDSLFDYMLKIVETSEIPKTLANVLSTVCWIANSSSEKRYRILPIVLSFMNSKPKMRLPVKFIII